MTEAVFTGPDDVAARLEAAGYLSDPLLQASAAHPGLPGPHLGPDPRRHLRPGVSVAAPTAARHHQRRADPPAHRRGGQGRLRVRGPAAGGPQRLPGHHPRDGHGGGDPAALRGAHLEQHPRAVRGAEAALPLPPPRLPGSCTREGHRRRPGARGAGAARGRPGARGALAALAGTQEGAVHRRDPRLGARTLLELGYDHIDEGVASSTITVLLKHRTDVDKGLAHLAAPAAATA